jgi:hypothetical protein
MGRSAVWVKAGPSEREAHHVADGCRTGKADAGSVHAQKDPP